MIHRKAILLSLLAVSMISLVSADKGKLPLSPEILKETGQNAIIAWNGEEEILIISTNVRATNPTKVLEIIPLPSKPEIKKVDKSVFQNLTKVIRGSKKGASLGGMKAPGVYVVLREKIGAHSITVVEVNDFREFENWFEDFVKEIGYNITLSKELRNILKDYISRNYSYFAMDLIEVGKEERSVEPLMYKFKSGKLYYPLKVSSLTDSRTHVNLFIFAKGVVMERDLKKIGFQKVKLSDVYTYIDREKLRKIHPDISEILDGGYFTYAIFYGNTSNLKRDLEVEKLYVPSLPDHIVKFFEGSTAYFLFSVILNLRGEGFELLPISILLFSTVSGFPAIFYVSFKALKNFTRRSVALISALALTLLIALTKEFLALLSLFVLFFFGFVFWIYIVKKLVWS